MASGTLSSNTSTAAVYVGYRQGSEPNMLLLSGSFGGGTITVEATVNDSTWVTCYDDAGDAIAFTAEGAYGLNLPAGPRYRLTMTGGTGQSVAWSLS